MLMISVTVISPMPSGKTRGVPPLISRSSDAESDLDQDDDQEHEDAERGHRLVLAMAVRMVRVRRPPRRRHADERDDVRGRVGQRVEAVGEDRDRAGRVAERDLRDRDREIDPQDAVEDRDDFAVSVLTEVKGNRLIFAFACQNTRALGIGHQRSCTLPMMYFFGTKPQWRLSELLFR